MKKILIVEDQRMPRENMERMIAESGRYESAGSISDAGLALARCCRIPVDLILMDVCTAGNRDGIEAAAEIKAKFPNIKIIIVTSMAEVGFLDRAKAAGADSFWYKDISREKLIDIIDRTMAGEKIFPDATPTVRLGLADSTELTAREINVLRLVCLRLLLFFRLRQRLRCRSSFQKPCFAAKAPHLRLNCRLTACRE